MLSIGKLGRGQERYYLDKVAEGAEDYYSGEAEAEGYWLGDAAEDLGLQGKVEPAQLVGMLTGNDPSTGEPLGLRHVEGGAVPGFDLTFSAPKSVSLTWALGGHPVAAEVKAAHAEAVKAGLDYLQGAACWTRRGAGGHVGKREPITLHERPGCTCGCGNSESWLRQGSTSEASVGGRSNRSGSSIKKILDAFAAVLDEAIEDEYRDDNPARSKRMHIKVPKPKRTYLEMDELAALLDAAREQDIALPDLAGAAVAAGSTEEKVLRAAAGGSGPKQIAADLGLAKSTVTYHLRKLGVQVGRGYIGRRVVCELLGRAGLRVSELCDLKIGDVRLHDPEGAQLRIIDAKTEAGERIVLVSPDLAEVIVEHIDRLRRAGLPTGPDDYLVPNTRGGRISRQRVAKIVSAAAKLASKRLRAKGLSPLPKTTPHTLRRTYISIALVANNFDVKWVMDQVGHSDSTMTMDVYAQLQQRVKRQHGKSFDRLLRRAKRQLAEVTTPA